MNLAEAQQYPSTFRRFLLINRDGESVRLGAAVDDWQKSDFEALDPAWRSIAGKQIKTTDVKYRAWLERPRGHSKTSDIAVMVTWALFASKQPIRGIAAAADRDQAALIRNAIQTIVRENVWLENILTVQQFKIENRHTGSVLEIISSDAASSYGHLPDFVICDELCHWTSRDLWDSLISSAAKRARCLFLCIGNAGFVQSWQWELREAIRQDANWHFSRLEAPIASWITRENLAEQRRLLPMLQYRRLWLNEWSTGSGDALSGTDIDAAVVLKGPLSQPERGWIYCAGLDLGLSRDKAALAVIGVHVGFSESTERPRVLTHQQQIRIELGLSDEPPPEYDEVYEPPTGKLKLVRLNVWNPADSETGKVKIEDVENTIIALHQRFQFVSIGADPWQTSYVIERLRNADMRIEPVDFTPKNLQSMCSVVLESFVERNIQLFPDANLLNDLRNLKIVEKSYGVRLESPRGPNGHGDSATALAICLHLAKNVQSHLATFSPDRKLICC